MRLAKQDVRSKSALFIHLSLSSKIVVLLLGKSLYSPNLSVSWEDVELLGIELVPEVKGGERGIGALSVFLGCGFAYSILQ